MLHRYRHLEAPELGMVAEHAERPKLEREARDGVLRRVRVVQVEVDGDRATRLHAVQTVASCTGYMYIYAAWHVSHAIDVRHVACMCVARCMAYATCCMLHSVCSANSDTNQLVAW
jgi:hypothetical protein